MERLVDNGVGVLEVSVKHSGSLFLWAGARRGAYAKNSYGNEYSAVGVWVLGETLRNAWGEGVVRQKQRELSDYLEHHRMAVGMELVTSVLGDHGQRPLQDYVVVTAVTDMSSHPPRFLSTPEVLRFCHTWRLPFNSYWLFHSTRSCSQLFAAYSALSEEGTAHSVEETLTGIADVTIAGTASHGKLQGNIMEGLVARLVSPRSLQQVRELKAEMLAGPAPSYSVGAGTRLRELFSQHDSMRERIAHLVEEAGDAMCSEGQWGEGVAGGYGSGGEDEEGGTVVDGEESESAGKAKQRRREQQEEERHVSDWMNSLLSCSAADAETSKLQAMLRAVKAEKLKVRFKSHPWPLPTSPSLLAPAPSPAPSPSISSTSTTTSSSSSAPSSSSSSHQPTSAPLSHHLITVHAFQDAAFRRYQQLMRKDPSLWPLYRGFFLEAAVVEVDKGTGKQLVAATADAAAAAGNDDDDDDDEVRSGRKENAKDLRQEESVESKGREEEEEGEEEGGDRKQVPHVMLKMKFLPYKLRTFLIRNGLGTLLKKGRHEYMAYATSESTLLKKGRHEYMAYATSLHSNLPPPHSPAGHLLSSSPHPPYPHWRCVCGSRLLKVWGTSPAATHEMTALCRAWCVHDAVRCNRVRCSAQSMMQISCPLPYTSSFLTSRLHSALPPPVPPRADYVLGPPSSPRPPKSVSSNSYLDYAEPFLAAYAKRGAAQAKAVGAAWEGEAGEGSEGKRGEGSEGTRGEESEGAAGGGEGRGEQGKGLLVFFPGIPGCAKSALSEALMQMGRGSGGGGGSDSAEQARTGREGESSAQGARDGGDASADPVAGAEAGAVEEEDGWQEVTRGKGKGKKGGRGGGEKGPGAGGGGGGERGGRRGERATGGEGGSKEGGEGRREVEEGGGPLGDGRECLHIMGDKTIGKYWKVLGARMRKERGASVNVLADKNAPNEEVWNQIEAMCHDTGLIGVPVVPASLGTLHNAFDWRVLAVFLFRVIQRTNHPGDLDSSSPAPGQVVLNFHSLYGRHNREDFEAELKQRFGVLVTMPVVKPDSPPLPEEIAGVIKTGHKLREKIWKRHKGKEPLKTPMAEEVLEWEGELRAVLHKHAPYLTSIQLPLDQVVATVQNQLHQIATGQIRPLVTAKTSFRSIQLAAVVIDPVADVAPGGADMATSGRQLLQTLEELARSDSRMADFWKTAEGPLRKKLEVGGGGGAAGGDGGSSRGLGWLHVTLAHKKEQGVPAVVGYAPMEGRAVTVLATALLFDQHVAALAVELRGGKDGEAVRSLNPFAHVTLWQAEGAKAVQSLDLPNAVERGEATRVPFPRPIELIGTTSAAARFPPRCAEPFLALSFRLFRASALRVRVLRAPAGMQGNEGAEGPSGGGGGAGRAKGKAAAEELGGSKKKAGIFLREREWGGVDGRERAVERKRKGD
ncbi:unnamed protein product [Closterium sp. Naga37s-1]|nr:unnamed protein product [Closterium sp. Naga37s-1]